MASQRSERRKGVGFGNAAGSVRIVVDEQGLADLVSKNKDIRDELMRVAKAVAGEAQATASAAENGSGGTLDGYSAAGFSVEWESRGGKRPRVNVRSNASGELATGVHFHTQKRDGVAHLRAALYKFTSKG